MSSFVIGVEFTLDEQAAGRVISAGPHGVIGVYERDWAELRTLFPAPRQFLARQFDDVRNGMTFSFPMLDSRAAESEHCCSLKLRIFELSSPLAETALLDFLKSVSESKDKEIATDPRRITVVQPSPFETKLLGSERTDAIELALDRPCILTGHG